LFICVFNVGAYMKSPKLIQSLATNISRFIHKFRLCFNGNENITVKKSQNIGEEFDHLWKDVCEEYFWIQNRGKDYLQWRYLSAPHRKYQIWKATEHDRLVGYLVTTIKHDSRGHRGFLVDWLVSRKRIDVYKAMIKSALEWLIDQKVYVVETLVLTHEKQWKKILGSHFFIKIKRTQSFLLCGSQELKTEDLFLTIGDSDQI